MNSDRPLTTEEKQMLLRIAREAIEAQLRNPPPRPPALTDLSPQLQLDGASFVTLTDHGELRGCIGSLQARRPLAHDVYHNALGAAFKDPRFPPLREGELAQITVEVSVLSQPEPLEYANAEALLDKLRPHVDGVVLKRGLRRATFLPQVWEKLPQPETFLTHLCYKAGLPPDAWRRSDVEIETYQVDKFKEGN